MEREHELYEYAEKIETKKKGCIFILQHQFIFVCL
jgi:hypothetical protein